MTNAWDKFKLLMWKNWVLQKRHKLQTIIEIFAPVVFATLMVLVRSLVEPDVIGEAHYAEFKPSNVTPPLSILIGSNSSSYDNITISYSPSSPLIHDILCGSMVYLVKEFIKNNPSRVPSFIPNPEKYLNCSTIQNNGFFTLVLNNYTNGVALENRLIDPVVNDSSFCGIQFDDSLSGIEHISEFPSNANLSIRFPAHLRNFYPLNPFLNWKTDYMYPVIQIPGPRNRNDIFGGWPSYMKEDFIPIMHSIVNNITDMKLKDLMETENKSFKVPELYMKRFPYPEYLSDDLLPVLRSFISIMIMLSFNYTCINTVRVIATEKEKQLKEVMKIMGLANWLHWTAWFMKTFSYLLISIILIVILLKVEWYSSISADNFNGYSVFTFTPWHVILFFMVLFIITSICFCFMISTFFSKANTAATVAGLLWFLSYAPYMFLANDREIPSFNSRIFACLASNTAMAYGFEIIISNEVTTQGLQWSNFFAPLTTDDSFVFGHVMLMLILDAILYLLIALYVEQVFPGSYGVARPWYFPVTSDYWKSCFKCSAVVEDIPQQDINHVNDTIEPEPNGLKVGVNIINLTKVFNKKTAVEKLSVKIFEDQITVLLGHNGAGKTTTMSMLTGILPPTSGTAIIAGHDIRRDISGVRDSLGLCPQHNVLFSDLTVAEHIYFYARLKGYTGKMLLNEVDKYVELLGLNDKRDVLSNALSGGMQRRLSVGCALCGGSRVVLLDEPSSGMDPSARRHLWDLLHAEKKGRTMILTTHFMDEAEILGERVAILAGGKLRCVGSPFYLKKKLGIGYRLIAARKVSSNGSFTAPSGPITNLLKKHISAVKLYTDIGSELSYVLPDELSGQFEPMLKDLEINQDKLGLIGFGISASTLEEVFMKVGSDSSTVLNDENPSVANDPDVNGFLENGIKNDDSIEKTELPECPPISFTGTKLFFNQIQAMLYKKFIVTKYTWVLGILQVVIPVLFLIIAIVVSRMWQNPVELPAKNLDLSYGYTDSVTYLSINGSLDDDANLIRKQYGEYFKDMNIPSMKYEETNKTMEEKYLEDAAIDIPATRKRNLVGATIGKDIMTAWFSNFAYHDLAASYVLAYKAIIKAVFPDFNLNIINRPLPFSLNFRNQLLVMGDGGGFQIAFNVGFSMAFVASFYVLFYIKENVSRSKLLQYASGASPSVMWIIAFIWDILNIFVISIALCITLAAFEQNGFSSGEELGRVLLLLTFFSLEMLPLHYIASSFFLTPSTGFSRMCLFNVFTGVAMFLVVEVLNAPGLDLEHVGNALHYVFLLFPHYSLCSGVRNLNFASVSLNTCLSLCKLSNSTETCNQSNFCPQSPYCCISDYPYFELAKPGIGTHLIYLSVTAVVLFIVLLVKEYNNNSGLMFKSKTPPQIESSEEDSDVAAERERIKNLDPSEYKNYNLVTNHMSKYYGDFLAVNQLTLGVQDGECFGLLGINGAGKTTTFKMLTGDLRISSGDAWVKGFSIKNDMETVYKKIGYCPQFDALLDEMTGKETLKMYSLLRGIPLHYQVRFTYDISNKLGFTKHLDKKVQEYSGGNKRKLSTSIALLGNPDVVYLDEPTTGMDPAAKRLVWNAIAGCNCVILTSHSMEECEALCSRLAIMVNGRPQCLGSPQHLKNKFSQGYTLLVKLQRNPSATRDSIKKPYPDILKGSSSQNPIANGNPSDSLISLNSSFNFGPLHEFLTSKFSNARMVESYQGLITYHLPDTSVYWSEIFGVMEKAKESLNIEDYSIGQTSLEQIFLQFTKDQIVLEK